MSERTSIRQASARATSSTSTDTRPLTDERDAVLARLREAREVFCFLDYDGTLAPIAPTPDEAYPLPGTEELLSSLTQARGTQVAIVSGRPIDDVRRFLDLPELYYVGIHGLEIRLPFESAPTSEGVAIIRSILPAIRKELERVLSGRPGILIEDKGGALACHYRLASGEDASQARRAMEQLTQRYQRRGVPVSLEYGRSVAEIRSATVNKGKTVCALLAARAPNALPVYIGDDRTDMDAFRLLPAQAITIHVAPAEPTPARYRVDDPAAVAEFLGALLACRSG